MTELRHLQMVLLSIIKDIDKLCQDNNIRYHLNGGSAIGAIRHKGFIPWDDDLDIEMTADNYYRFIKVCREKLDTNKYYFQEGLVDWPLDSCKIKLLGTRYDEPEAYADSDTHRGIFIDIFRLDKAAPTKVGQMWQFFCAKYRLAYLLSMRTYKSASLKKKIIMLLASPQRIAFIGNFFKYQQTKYNAKDGDTGFYGLLTQKTRWPHCIIRSEFVKDTLKVPFEDCMLPVAGLYNEYLSNIFGNYMQLPPEDKRLTHAIDVDFGNY